MKPNDLTSRAVGVTMIAHGLVTYGESDKFQFLTVDSLRRGLSAADFAPVNRRQLPMMLGHASWVVACFLFLSQLRRRDGWTWGFKEVSAAIRFLARFRFLFCFLALEK